MREIATRVGVTEPALYRHFPSKEALFVALIHSLATRMRAEAFSLIDGVRAETIRFQLIAAFAKRRRMMSFYGPLLRTVLAAGAHSPAFLSEYRTQLADPARLRLVMKAAELDATFGVPAADETRDARVRALMALFVGYLVTEIVMEDRSDEPIADAVLRVMGWESAIPSAASPSS